jgi:signal peptidase I
MQVSRQAIQVVKKVIGEHRWIELPAKGTSMYPYIKEGDICTFETSALPDLEKGDVILFHNVQGQLISHRFIKTTMIDGDRYLMCKGDTNFGYDEPILPQQVIGKLMYIKRRNIHSSASAWSAILWREAILRFPSLTHVLRVYVNRKAVRY